MGVIGNGFGVVIASGVNTNPDGENTPLYFANCATPVALPTSTYNNGTSGVGATLTATVNGALTTTYTDGVALSVGLIVLVWKQSSALQNGLYEVTQIGSGSLPWILTRLGVYDDSSEIYPSQVNILGGSTYANQYFLQQTVNPTIGSSSLVYGTVTPPTSTAVNQTLNLVDTYTTSALPTCTYTRNASTTKPGLNAYLNASSNGAFPTLNGVAPFQYMKVLVSGQADQTQNGDYILQNVGSASSTWRLSRLSYTSAQFYRAWWGIYSGTGKGLIFEQTTSTLTTANIGLSGNIVFSNFAPSIYTGDGDLTSNRTITQNGYYLREYGGVGSQARHILDSDNNIGAIFSFRTANLPRWALRKDGNETGSNVGGDFAIRRYDDAGAYIDSPISINRSSGNITVAKKFIPNAQTVASASNVTANADTDNIVVITDQATGLTLDNPSGTPVQGQALFYRIKDNGVSRTVAYGSQFRAIGVTLPTSTTISKTIYLGCIYNSTDSKWDVIGVNIQA